VIASISYPPIPIFELGPLNLSLHGLFAGIGFVVGAWLMLREVKRRGFDAEKVLSVLTWALVASILGARLFTVPAHMFETGYGISDAINVSGDYSILGGYAGGIIGGVIRMRMLRLPVLALLDMAAPGLAVGAVVGRIGDLAIVEHLGSETSFFLGYTLKPGYDISPQHDVLERLCNVEGICGTYHHTGLYDMIGAMVLLGFIYYLMRHWSYRYGQMFSVWVMWYGVQRFLIDFTRLDAARNGTVADSVMGPFTGSQWGALGAALLGLALFVWFGRRSDVVSVERDIEYGAETSLSEETVSS
jgi:phosphatidylglycerol:prolipoprotein diacylglycerol transferase